MAIFFQYISCFILFNKIHEMANKEPDPGPVPYMEIDHEIVQSFFSLPLIQEELLSVRNEYIVCSRSTG